MPGRSPQTQAGDGATRPLLCVTVPTIPGRESLLSRCLWSVTEQWQPGVEILVVDGPGLLGDKINQAAQHTRAEYMTVVDDDDYLDGAYLSLILPALHDRPDFVGLKVLQWIDQQFYGIASTRGDRDRFEHDGSNHGPTAKGVTRTDIWRRCPYGNDYKSDRAWIPEAFAHIRTHRFVDRAIYVYDHQPAVSAFVGDGSGRDIGVWPFNPLLVERITSI